MKEAEPRRLRRAILGQLGSAGRLANLDADNSLCTPQNSSQILIYRRGHFHKHFRPVNPADLSCFTSSLHIASFCTADKALTYLNDIWPFWARSWKTSRIREAYKEEMQGLNIERLEPKEISQAFPLIQLQHKGLTIAQWSDYAHRIVASSDGRQRGILAARNNQGVIYGILQYEIRCDIEGLRQMAAANVVACGLFQEHNVHLTAAMIETLERMALESGCRRVLIVFPESSDPATIRRLAAILETSGHRFTNNTFSKHFEHAQREK